MNPYDIHIAYVSWVSIHSHSPNAPSAAAFLPLHSDGKRRPVLVLSSGQKEVAVFQITSQYDSKSAAIQSQYISIDDWAQAGLERQSYIDIGRIVDLPISVVQPTPIGKLSTSDLQKLLQAMKSL